MFISPTPSAVKVTRVVGAWVRHGTITEPSLLTGASPRASSGLDHFSGVTGYSSGSFRFPVSRTDTLNFCVFWVRTWYRSRVILFVAMGTPFWSIWVGGVGLKLDSYPRPTNT